jgi:hypothetical protein
MQKPLALTIAVCLGLTGCGVFQKSPTWDKVTKVRPGETTRDPDPSAAYAAKLHRALAESGVQHKVVTYQYRYLTNLREEAVGTRTAVIYRDNTNSKYPWWLKDDRLGRPVWLPNGELNKQIGFYIRREAEVLEQKNYSGGGGGKTTIAFARPTVTPRHSLFAEHGSAVTKIVPVKKAPEPVVRQVIVKAPAAKPQPARRVVAKTPAASEPVAPEKAITKIHFSSKPPESEHIAATELLPPPPIASRSPAPWTSPTELTAEHHSKEIAPADERLEKLFREKNGTKYEPTSTVDRRKMQRLKQTEAARE